MIEDRIRWRTIDGQWSYFETQWIPKSWDTSYRFLLIRKRVKTQQKGPWQLHLFEPRELHFDYKVIATKKTEWAKSVVVFPNGRGTQETIFGEAKRDVGLDPLPYRRLAGNQISTLCAMMAHNLGREIQMLACPSALRSLPKRPSHWGFEKLDTLRHRIIQRTGRLTRPSGELTLTMSANQSVQHDLLHFLHVLQKAAQ
jgi:hypothetical protein